MNIELLNSIDSFVWGPPLLVLLVGTGIFLTLRLGFLQVSRLPKALQLIFKAETPAKVTLTVSRPCVQPLQPPLVRGISSVSRQLLKQAVREPSSGCGLPPSLVWQQNTRKVSLLSNTARSTPKVRFLAARCTTLSWVWGKSTNPCHSLRFLWNPCCLLWYRDLCPGEFHR